MTHDEAVKFREEQNLSLVKKGTLLLTVRLDSPEQADEIMQWMYAKDKPMKATLLEIAWDKVAVRKEQAEALEMLRQSFAV